MLAILLPNPNDSHVKHYMKVRMVRLFHATREAHIVKTSGLPNEYGLALCGDHLPVNRQRGTTIPTYPPRPS